MQKHVNSMQERQVVDEEQPRYEQKTRTMKLKDEHKGGEEEVHTTGRKKL